MKINGKLAWPLTRLVEADECRLVIDTPIDTDAVTQSRMRVYDTLDQRIRTEVKTVILRLRFDGSVQGFAPGVTAHCQSLYQELVFIFL